MARWTRRDLLVRTGGTGLGLFLLAPAGSAWSYQANEKLNLAVVGLGARGPYLVDVVKRVGENLLAVCDVNRQRLQPIAQQQPDVKTYQDFRRMLDEMDRQLDALMVATPDHNLAVISAAAIKRGKHVYCEKPIAHDVAEARRLRELARQHKVVTQMGNQGMATDAFRRTLELIQDGAIGQIREAHVWFVFGHPGYKERPKDTPPVPEYLDWDLWLGPAPYRPYHPSYLASERAWRGWRDFGTGWIGGGGSHAIHLTFQALDLIAFWQGRAQGPIRIVPETQGEGSEGFPQIEILRWEVPARGQLPPAVIHWYNAPEEELRRRGIWQNLEKLAGRSLDWQKGWTPRSGSLLVGSKGLVHTNAHNSLCTFLPEKDFPQDIGRPQRLRSVQSHEREWFQACRGGPPAMSNFDYAGPAIEFLMAANIATLVNRPIEFDPATLTIRNDPEAHRAIQGYHRPGWEV